MVRAIQAGVGWWGMRWVKDFAPAVPDVEMVGYVARSERSKAALADAGVPARMMFPTLAEAAGATGADLLINATRTAAHHGVIAEALGLGLHVLTEKPFAATVAEGRDLVGRAAEAGRFLGVAENYRYDPAAIAAERLMRQGIFGPPTRLGVAFRKHVKTMGFPHPYPEIDDPVLEDVGIHHFHLMRWMLADEPVRVAALGWNQPASGFAGRPSAVAIVEFSRGTIATLDSSFLSAAPETSWGGEWSMECADGEIWWTNRDGADRVVLRPLGGVPEDLSLAVPAYADASGALHAMVVAITTGTPPTELVTGSDNLRSLALAHAAIRSAERRGEWVNVAELLDA